MAYEVPSSYVVPVNFGLFVIGNLYLAGLAFDALRTRNNLQLFGICTFNVGVFVFSIMRYGQTHENAGRLALNHALGNRPFVKEDILFWSKVKPALIVSSILVGACMVSSWLLTFRLNREFAWAIYRHISGSLSIRRKYLTYQVSIVAIFDDVYADKFAGFARGFEVGNLLPNRFHRCVWPGRRSLRTSRVPIDNCCHPSALYTSRDDDLLHEAGEQVGRTCSYCRSTCGAIVTSILLADSHVQVLRLGEMAYLVSRILILTGVPPSLRSNTILKNEMLLFAGCSLALATIACGNATVCLLNFGQGLKPLLMDTGWKQGRYEFEPIHAQGRLSARLELD